MWRSIGAVVLGLIVAMLVIMIVETISHMAYPPPAGLDPNNPDDVQKMMAQAPVGALLFVLAAFACGAMDGAWVAARVAKRRKLLHGLIVGGILMVFGIANLLMISHPAWFAVASLLMYLPPAWLGAWWATRRRGEEEENDAAPANA